MKSRAICSSWAAESNEYVPGRSTSLYRLPLNRYPPSARVTVLPGQLPVCCLSPVIWLNTLLLPEFGLPASATT